MSDKQQLRFQREWEVKKGEEMSTRTSEEKGKTRADGRVSETNSEDVMETKPPKFCAARE